MNIEKDKLLNLINVSIDDTNLLLEKSLNLNNVGIHDKNCFENLDSLGIVNFLYNIENNFQKTYHIKVNILNDNFYDDPISHLASVESLISFMESCINNE